jgi:hypothetical protein
MNSILDIQQSISALRSSINEAQQAFNEDNEFNDPAWHIESCFLKLLTVTEAMELIEINKIVTQEYNAIKASKGGFGATDKTPDNDLYPIHLARARQFFATLAIFFPLEEQTKFTQDLLQIIRDIHYTITDDDLFGSVPKNEKDVHLRIEGILKPIFPDLKHKPALAKPIKNFEPDTGIPSLQTLIEYKFLSRKGDIPLFADQILADTRGYFSKEWKRFVYVVYETKRFKPEREWNNLLRESGVPSDTTVVVLSGETPK